MTIINHGIWESYRPGKLPKDAPTNALFARRKGDGVDWYAYVNSGANFAPTSVKMTVVNGIVGAAVTDATMLFPAGATVLESSEAVAEPQKMFGDKVYDAASKTFKDRPPLQLPPSPDELLKRIEALEGKGP